MFFKLNNKRNGFVLVEALILINIIILILSISTKEIAVEFVKNDIYSIKDDSRTLSDLEIKLKNTVEKNINSDKELKENILNNKLESINLKEISKEDKNLYIQISNGDIILAQKNENKIFFNELKIGVNEDKKIILIPTFNNGVL